MACIDLTRVHAVTYHLDDSFDLIWNRDELGELLDANGDWVVGNIPKLGAELLGLGAGPTEGEGELHFSGFDWIIDWQEEGHELALYIGESYGHGRGIYGNTHPVELGRLIEEALDDLKGLTCQSTTTT